MTAPDGASLDSLDALDLAGLRVAALRTALELDLFSAVAAGASSVPALAAARDCSSRGISILVNALHGIGLLRVSGDTISNTATAATYLCAGSPGDTRAIYLDWMRNRDHLLEAVRSGQAVATHATEQHGQAWGSYASMSVPDWRSQVDGLVEAFGNRGFRVQPDQTVADIGCGSGILALSLIHGVPGARAILIDRPEVLEVASRLAADMGLTDRTTLIAGEASTLDLAPGSIDYAFLVNVAQYLHDDVLLAAVDVLKSAVRPSGAVYVRCPVTDPTDDPDDPTWATLLEMYLASSVPQRSTAEYLALFATAGFPDVTAEPGGRFTLR